MKIAAYRVGGERRVGLVDERRQTVAAFDIPDTGTRLGALGDTRIQCRINGELRQSANTRDLIFDVPTIIETISAGVTLMPGDVIASGTPAGVGIGFKPPRYLVPGDVARIEISGIGVLENEFREARS